MKTLLQLLREGRTARRDAVLGRLHGLQAQLAAACEAQRDALAAIEHAIAARHMPWAASGPTADPQWRLAMQASCDALIERRHAEALTADAATRRCNEALGVQRAALTDCERALMRHDEWAAHERRRARVAERLDEQNQDDDFAAQFRAAADSITTGAAGHAGAAT